jgi:hypothetical protein
MFILSVAWYSLTGQSMTSTRRIDHDARKKCQKMPDSRVGQRIAFLKVKSPTSEFWHSIFHFHSISLRAYFHKRKFQIIIRVFPYQ